MFSPIAIGFATAGRADAVRRWHQAGTHWLPANGNGSREPLTQTLQVAGANLPGDHYRQFVAAKCAA